MLVFLSVCPLVCGRPIIAYNISLREKVSDMSNSVSHISTLGVRCYFVIKLIICILTNLLFFMLFLLQEFLMSHILYMILRNYTNTCKYNPFYLNI
jgi:hypothetical protein